MISGWNMWNLWHECSRSGQLHIGRARCRWDRAISSLNQLALIFEIVTFILYKSVIHDFRQKYMKHLERVVSKWATPHRASMVSLESWHTLIKTINTYISNCHIYHVQKCDSWFRDEIYETFITSVLEVGNSTSGEHGVIGIVAYPH